MREAADIPGAFAEEEQATTPVAEGLQAMVPAPPGADEEALAEESLQRRVLIMRGGAVVAVTTLISIGGSLLIHGMFTGIVVLGLMLPWPGVKKGPNDELQGVDADAGGASGGYMVSGSGAEDNAPPSPKLAELLGKPNAGVVASSLPPLPKLPEVTTAQMAAAQLAPAEAPLATPADLGNVRVIPKALPGLPAVAEGVRVEPPTAQVAGTRGAQIPGVDAGDGGFADEPAFDHMKGDGSGGSGSGGRSRAGLGMGGGMNRGMSAADRPAQLLELAEQFNLPDKYLAKLPSRSVKVSVTVLASGKVGDIKIEQSCGIGEIDQKVVDIVANSKFSPAYHAGKAINSVFPFEQSFRPFD